MNPQENMNPEENTNPREEALVNTAPNQNYVFISYSSKNKELADDIRNIMAKNGIASWMAPNSIPTGSKYAKEITSALKQCTCLLLLLTNYSQNSKWVSREVERAIDYGKTIIAIELEDIVLNEEFEFYLSISQRLSLNHFDENASETKELIHRIKTLLNSPNKEQ